MSHFLTDRKPAFLTAPVQLKEAAELMGLVLTGEEDRSISSSEMAVVKDILSSSDICRKDPRKERPLIHHFTLKKEPTIHSVYTHRVKNT